MFYVMFLLNETATTCISTYCHTLSLHDPLPILVSLDQPLRQRRADPPWHNRWQATRPITLAMLLEHSAGWFDMGRAEFDSADRSEEHTSELQSLMRISYAVF